MAVHYARARRARDVIDAEGALSRGSTGQLVEHPAVRIEREATRLFHSLASDYALTPSSRTRLGLDLLLGARMQRSFETPADTDELGPNPRRLRGVDPA